MTGDLFAYVDEHLPEFVADVVRLCRQPSISARGEGLTEMAQLVVNAMTALGIQAQALPTAGGPPVVYGEMAGDRPTTLLFYNHYDVQPPEPLELWTTPPFEPVVDGDKLRGRGVADNKGNLAARLAAIKTYLAVRGRLPLNVKFCVEGEEEVGSPHLAPFVEAHGERLKADACLWEGSGVNWQGQPTVILGAKGILYVELEARGAVRDVHSSLATVVPNPAWRLVWALSSLKDSQENILIPGFYDDVTPLSPQELEAVQAIPPDDQELKESLGLEKLVADVEGFQYIRRHLFEPTCTICGLVSGYTGEGAKTVLPSIARAKIDFRLVPEQRPQDIHQKLKRHLESQGFGDIAVSAVEGVNPARTPLNSPLVRVVVEAAQEVYRRPPVVYPTMAATGPMYLFTSASGGLGIPTASSGIEYPDCRMHAPDEHIRLQDFALGIKHLVAIMAHMAEEGRRD
ncbi:MAG: M20/M25/M40 family metallo-hydrolase [Chloroflexi bacterium]|nr:M20/M25/M40 family metallo-hydrolase [Chloroflexota bacterium]